MPCPSWTWTPSWPGAPRWRWSTSWPIPTRRTTPPQALPGRGRDPGCRDRRLYHPQHPAPRKPERHRVAGHGPSGCARRSRDRVIDEATDLELVDLPPDELRNRLEEARSTSPSNPPRPSVPSFEPETSPPCASSPCAVPPSGSTSRCGLHAGASHPGPWPAGEHVLVCVSPSPQSERLVRSARRLAGELNARWTALYIETPDRLGLADAEQDRLARTQHLAEELGGRVPHPDRPLGGRDSGRLCQAAQRDQDRGRPVVGARWRHLLRGSVVDQIVQAAGPIDVYVIGAGAATAGDRGWRDGAPTRLGGDTVRPFFWWSWQPAEQRDASLPGADQPGDDLPSGGRACRPLSRPVGPPCWPRFSASWSSTFSSFLPT